MDKCTIALTIQCVWEIARTLPSPYKDERQRQNHTNGTVSYGTVEASLSDRKTTAAPPVYPLEIEVAVSSLSTAAKFSNGEYSRKT